MDSDESPMARWNQDTLVALQGDLKLNVITSTGLTDRLQRAAGGFMDRAEAQAVESKPRNEQMGEVIRILLGKRNADFKIFCRILRDSNYSVWADQLEKKATESHKVQPTVSEQKDDITALLKHAHERQAVAQSPVVEAARHNQLPTVRILLDGETATVDDQDEDGRTALMWASRNGHQEIVSLLVDDYNANVFQRDEDGFNALHVAAQGGHWEVIKLLHRKFGARVHDGDNNNDTMLHWAAFSGHCGVARYLIEEFGMDPQDRDKWGATALLSAAFGGSALVGKMLLEEFGSSIDEEAYDNCHGWNALHFAAGACHLEMVKYLLPLFGEKKFKQDNDGRTCLDLAINAKCREVVAYLLQEGGFANHLN